MKNNTIKLSEIPDIDEFLLQEHKTIVINTGGKNIVLLMEILQSKGWELNGLKPLEFIKVVFHDKARSVSDLKVVILRKIPNVSKPYMSWCPSGCDNLYCINESFFVDCHPKNSFHLKLVIDEASQKVPQKSESLVSLFGRLIAGNDDFK